MKWKRKFGRWYYSGEKYDWAWIQKCGPRSWLPQGTNKVPPRDGFTTLREAKAWIEANVKVGKRT